MFRLHSKDSVNKRFTGSYKKSAFQTNETLILVRSRVYVYIIRY